MVILKPAGLPSTGLGFAVLAIGSQRYRPVPSPATGPAGAADCTRMSSFSAEVAARHRQRILADSPYGEGEGESASRIQLDSWLESGSDLHFLGFTEFKLWIFEST